MPAMMRSPVLVAFFAWLLSACAGGGSAMPAVAPAPPMPEAVAAAPPSPIVAEPFAAGGAGNLFAAPGAGQPPPPPPPPPAKGLPGPEEATTVSRARREAMIIYTASLVLAVYQVEQNLSKIEEIATASGGYLGSRNDDSITVRIPRAKFHDVVASVEKLGDVIHRKVDAQDVSDQVVDLEARLKNARAMRDRLASLLTGAPATKDALEIEKELSRVMGDIESIEGKLTLLADKIAYSTLSVSFQPLQVAEVHSMARLPFPWLQSLGLPGLLRVN
jgi:hypothetical protein